MVLRGSVPHPPFGDSLPEGVVSCAFPARIGALTACIAPAVSAGDEAPRVLIIPGFTGSKEDFTPFLSLLAQRGITSVCYSQRGQADSVAPKGLDNYRLRDFVDDAAEVARAMGADEQPIHLMGHSFGGVIAREAAVRYPELFASLVLFSSGPKPALSMRMAPIQYSLMRSSAGRVLTGWVIAYCLSTDPRRRFLIDRARATSPDHLEGAARVLASYPDVTARLARTDLPVLITHGEGDRAWPQSFHEAEVRALGARYEVIPGAQHSAQFENPEGLADVLADFWRDPTARSPKGSDAS